MSIEEELIKASAHGKLDTVEHILAGYPDTDVNWIDERYGMSAVMTAAGNGHADTVRRLIAHGAELDTRDNYNDGGFTALIEAARFGHVDCVKVLLDAGTCDINFTTALGDSALYLATRDGHVAVARELLSHPEIRINQKFRDGWTATHLAARGGHLEIVSELIKRGADYKLKNNDNETPQEVAANDEIKNLLGDADRIIAKQRAREEAQARAAAAAELKLKEEREKMEHDLLVATALKNQQHVQHVAPRTVSPVKYSLGLGDMEIHSSHSHFTPRSSHHINLLEARLMDKTQAMAEMNERIVDLEHQNLAQQHLIAELQSILGGTAVDGLEHQNHANQNLIADLQSKIAASAVTRGVHSSSHTKRPSNDDDGMPEVSMADIITHPVSSSGGGPYSHSRNHSPERVVRIKEGSSSSAYSATAAALASSDLGGMVRPVSQSHTRSPDQMVVRVGEVSGTGSIGSSSSGCSAVCQETMVRLEEEVSHLNHQNDRLKATVKTLME